MKRERKRRLLRPITLLCAAALLLGVLTGCGGKKAAGGESQPGTVPEAGLTLPYRIEKAGLEIRECFTASVPNPDSGDRQAEDAAALEIVNRSGKYLKQAVLTVETSDDSTYKFSVMDLPVEGTAWAFDVENRTYDEQAGIRSVQCSQVEYGQPDQELLDSLSVEEQDLTVTLTNTGTETLEHLEAVCRCNFGELYFGGISYCYPVERLAPGESVTLDAAECYMGTAEVVDVRHAAD